MIFKKPVIYDRCFCLMEHKWNISLITAWKILLNEYDRKAKSWLHSPFAEMIYNLIYWIPNQSISIGYYCLLDFSYLIPLSFYSFIKVLIQVFFFITWNHFISYSDYVTISMVSGLKTKIQLIGATRVHIESIPLYERQILYTFRLYSIDDHLKCMFHHRQMNYFANWNVFQLLFKFYILIIWQILFPSNR